MLITTGQKSPHIPSFLWGLSKSPLYWIRSVKFSTWSLLLSSTYLDILCIVSETLKLYMVSCSIYLKTNLGQFGSYLQLHLTTMWHLLWLHPDIQPRTLVWIVSLPNTGFWFPGSISIWNWLLLWKILSTSTFVSLLLVTTLCRFLLYVNVSSIVTTVYWMTWTES